MNEVCPRLEGRQPRARGAVEEAIVLIDDDLTVDLEDHRGTQDVLRRRRDQVKPRAVPEVVPLPIRQLDDLVEAKLAHPIGQRSRRQRWQDHPRGLREVAQRLDVEMIRKRTADEEGRCVVEARGLDTAVVWKLMSSPEIGAPRAEPGITDDA